MRIRKPGRKNSNPGSGREKSRIRENISDPQHSCWRGLDLPLAFANANEEIGKGINYGTVHTVHEIVWLKRHTQVKMQPKTKYRSVQLQYYAELRIRISLVRIRTFHFIADPDPPFHFNSDPDPAPH
jgi:hypothetical protein